MLCRSRLLLPGPKGSSVLHACRDKDLCLDPGPGHSCAPSSSPCCVRPGGSRSCSCWPCLRVSTSDSAAHPGTHFLRVTERNVVSASYTAGGQRLQAVGHSFTQWCAVPPVSWKSLKGTQGLAHGSSGTRDGSPFEEEHRTVGLWQLCLGPPPGVAGMASEVGTWRPFALDPGTFPLQVSAFLQGKASG